MRKILTLLLSAVFMALVVPAVSQAQSVKLVNHAGLSSRQVSNFKAAVKSAINGKLDSHWGTPRLRWGGGGWKIVFYNRLGPVEAFCGAGAAGCHGMKNGTPYAVVDTNITETGRIWSVAGSHEMDEMWVDPTLNHYNDVAGVPGAFFIDEVSDPVEDFYAMQHGVDITDYVYPNWFNNVNGRQDNEGKDRYYGAGQWGFSCPTGFISIWNGSWREIGPLVNGGCMIKSNRISARSIAESNPITHAANQQGNRVVVFPITGTGGSK